jgi:hypothetical protein
MAAQAQASAAVGRPTSRVMAVVIVAIWVIAIGATGLWLWQAVRT